MQVIVNQTPLLLQGCHLSDLCCQLNLEPVGMAIAVNGTVVPQSQWQSHALNPNDSVTLVRATRGG